MEEKRVCLVMIKSSEGQRAHLIDKATFTVGRAQEADLPYLTPSVSRLHLNVEIRGDAAWVLDGKSANGTFLNGNPVEKGKSYRVDPQDVIRLGTAPEEFQFTIIPKPFEMLNPEAQKGTFLGSMEELVKQVEKKLELQYRDRVEKQIRMAQLEAEEVLSQARKEGEILRTQGLLELQNRKQELESEIGRLEQEAKMAAARERLSSRKVADQMVAEAQKRIQKDYDESSQQMETRFKDMQAKCSLMFEQAEETSKSVLAEAQAEASRVRREATEEARSIQSEARRKRDEAFSSLQAQFQKEVHDKREEIIAQAKKDAAAERHQLLNDLVQQTEGLRSELQFQETRRTDLSAEIDQLNQDRERMAGIVKDLQAKSENAEQLLAAVEDLEKRKINAEREYKHFVRVRDEGNSKLDSEIRQLRETRIVEIENRKKEQLTEIAKERLKAIDDLKRELEAREEDYRKTRRLRAIELTQKLQERVTPRFQHWHQNPSSAGSEFKTAIEQAVNECLLNESSIQASVTVAENAATVSNEVRSRKLFKYVGYAALCIIMVAGFYHQELAKYLQGQEKNSYASKMIEDRRIQSIYDYSKDPKYSETYKNTYTDNVLYMKDYFETKSNSVYIEKWTLQLTTDLKFLNSIGLSEENVIMFVSKETNLVQQLGKLRDHIDAVYLQQGIDDMRKAEAEAEADFLTPTILKDRVTYEKIRHAEKAFIEEFRRKQVLK